MFVTGVSGRTSAAVRESERGTFEAVAVEVGHGNGWDDVAAVGGDSDLVVVLLTHCRGGGAGSHHRRSGPRDRQGRRPALSLRAWYGVPAYAKDETVTCFFQDTQKFKARDTTLGLSDQANLNEEEMWPAAFALTEWTTVEA